MIGRARPGKLVHELQSLGALVEFMICQTLSGPLPQSGSPARGLYFQREIGPQRQAIYDMTSPAIRGWVRVRVLEYGSGVRGRKI